ncbi:poly(R)-hydroxyalkanoic acid synthase subunit PhaE [Pseudoruegeria sp. SK021]|uniref:poly(R)-hydroxyalkanoic acid synthase subunit PhaE n=1 Tax=Pseudoruegeria sp. SK021 TaxID=1933035 RepID=UPI000A247879|nr:poly(R)-hydroxyalkanoic acid synthase subunit PhaE [Pseudoruegeria sp. SK021]OSP55368.1 hypothetical protein BV911_07990 [Pseudoruegeria sp. SK021]
MSQSASPFSPFLDALLSAQITALQAQEPFWKAVGSAVDAAGGDGAAANAFWDEANHLRADWVSKLSPAGSGDDTALETLRRMLDPAQFLGAGSDDINVTLRKLLEGHNLSGLGAADPKLQSVAQDWATLCEAGARYRLVMGQAWMRAFETFAEVVNADPALAASGPRALSDRWLAIANDELIATQRSEPFLDAQRMLLRAGVAYRQRERDVIESWCEAHAIPTRSEIDDMHLTLHVLRRQVRELRKQLADASMAVHPGSGC